MPSLDAQFFKPFVQGALKTLTTQCSMVISAQKPFIKGKQPQAHIAIAGVIGITSNTFNGTITLCFPEVVFLGAMSAMLGETFKEITDDLQDGVAELLNIIFGQAKIVLNQQGYSIQKAIPTVVRGTNLSTRAMSHSLVMVLPFKTELGEFFIEICSEESKPAS